MENILNREPIKNSSLGKAGDANLSTPAVKVSPEVISVSKAEWDAMKETVKLLEEGGTRKIPKVKDRLVRIRLWENKIVTGMGKSWMERKFGDLNKTENDRLFAKIILEDKTERTVNFLDFLNEAEQLICSVKKIDKKDASIVHGTFETENSNPKDVKNFRSEEAQDIEQKTDDDYTLEITSGERKGEKIVLNHLALNL